MWGVNHKGMGPFLWGGVKAPCKDFNLAIGGELGLIKLL